MMEILIGSMIALCEVVRILMWSKDNKISDVRLQSYSNSINFTETQVTKYKKTIDGEKTSESLRLNTKRIRKRYPFAYKIIYVFEKEK